MHNAIWYNINCAKVEVEDPPREGCARSKASGVKPALAGLRTLDNKGGNHSGGGLFLRTLLAESFSIFHDLAMGETPATEAKRRWNAEGAGMPPLPNHRKNKGRRHQCEENKATP